MKDKPRKVCFKTHTHKTHLILYVCLLKIAFFFSSMSLRKLKRLDWVEILLEAAWEQSQHFSPNRFSYNFISPTSFFQRSMLLVFFFPWYNTVFHLSVIFVLYLNFLSMTIPALKCKFKWSGFLVAFIFYYFVFGGIDWDSQLRL